MVWVAVSASSLGRTTTVWVASQILIMESPNKITPSPPLMFAAGVVSVHQNLQDVRHLL